MTNKGKCKHDWRLLQDYDYAFVVSFYCTKCLKTTALRKRGYEEMLDEKLKELKK